MSGLINWMGSFWYSEEAKISTTTVSTEEFQEIVHEPDSEPEKSDSASSDSEEAQPEDNSEESESESENNDIPESVMDKTQFVLTTSQAKVIRDVFFNLNKLGFAGIFLDCTQNGATVKTSNEDNSIMINLDLPWHEFMDYKCVSKGEENAVLQLFLNLEKIAPFLKKKIRSVNDMITIQSDGKEVVFLVNNPSKGKTSNLSLELPDTISIEDDPTAQYATNFPQVVSLLSQDILLTLLEFKEGNPNLDSAEIEISFSNRALRFSYKQSQEFEGGSTNDLMQSTVHCRDTIHSTIHCKTSNQPQRKDFVSVGRFNLRELIYVFNFGNQYTKIFLKENSPMAVQHDLGLGTLTFVLTPCS